MAIKELPQLRHISYSDYRSLAYEGESYGELCRRLFGNMLCPNLDYSIFYNPMYLETFLEDLAEHRPILQSLSIGRQPFERSPIEEQSYYSAEADADPTGNGFTVLDCQSLFPTTNGVDTPKIQAHVLRLPLLCGVSLSRQLQHERESSAPEDIDRLIRNFGTGMVDLEVGSGAFLVEFERSKLQGTLLSYPHVPLNTIKALNLSDVNVLKSLSLRGFKFNVPSLRNGLSKCAKTLRILRLVDCYCRETYNAFESFAKQELASNLSLTGVEIHSLLFIETHNLDMNLSWEVSFRIYEHIMCPELASRYGIDALDSHARTMDHQALKASSVQRGIDMVAGWPYARYELENATLGGRINTVLRKVRSFLKVHRRDLDVGGNNWWEEPVSYN